MNVSAVMDIATKAPTIMSVGLDRRIFSIVSIRKNSSALFLRAPMPLLANRRLSFILVLMNLKLVLVSRTIFDSFGLKT